MKKIFIFIFILFFSTSLSFADETVDKAYNWFEYQQDTNRFLLFFSNGLVPSYEDGEDCFTYDEALSAIVFTLSGDHKRAQKILKFYEGVYRKQKRRFGKFRGFTDVYKRSGKETETWAAGPNAWLLMAINHYTYRTKDTKYLELAENLAGWLISLRSVDGGIIGGYYGTGEPMTWTSTEHNFDCYAAFRDLGILTGDRRYLEAAKEIKLWLEDAAWNKEQKRFNMGQNNPNYATDLSSWAILSLGKKYDVTLDFAIDKSLNKKLYKIKNIEIEGFDFGSTYQQSHYPDKDAVWLEGTAHMVLAFDRAGKVEQKEHFLAELDKALTQSQLYKNSAGLPYATNEGTPAYGSWLMKDKPLCIASTAWYIFAKENFNPFSIDQKEDISNKTIEELEYQPNYQFVPCVDNFEYGEVKFQTSYLKEYIFEKGATIERLLQEGISTDGLYSMKIVFKPAQNARLSEGIIARRFLYPQDWSGHTKLTFWVFVDGSENSVKLGLKDKEAEPFESHAIRLNKDEKGWRKLSFNLETDFSRKSSLMGYGNNLLDREGIREISIELRSENSTKSEIYIDNLKLENAAPF